MGRWRLLGSAALPAVLLLLGSIQHLATILNHDVAWMLVVAGRMLDGGTYGADFVEFNLPLAVAAYIPPQLIHRLTALSLPDATHAWVLALIAQTMILAHCVRVRNDLQSPALRAALWQCWTVIALVFLPAYHFAQREHLMMILVLPFLLSMSSTDRPGIALRSYVALLAAIGFYLKPHYAALPFLLLALRAWRERSWRALWSLESAVLVGCGAALALVTVIVYPEWFSLASWASDLYRGYDQPLKDVLTDPLLLRWVLVPLALGFVLLRVDTLRWRIAPLVLVATYGLLAYAAQRKGWEYQLLPAEIAVFLLCGYAALGVPLGPVQRRHLFPGVAALASVALAVHAIQTMQHAPKARDVQRSNLTPAYLAFDGVPPGETVYALSTGVIPAFPTVVMMGLRWGSRYPSLWPLPRLLWAQRQSPAASALLDRYRAPFIDAIRDDLLRYQPKLVLVDANVSQMAVPANTDLLAFFLSDARFAETWGRYEQVATMPGFRLYALKDEIAPQ